MAGMAAGFTAAIPSLVAAGGALAGDALQGVQASNLNLANRMWSAQQADINRQFQVSQTKEAQDWMTQMSNTAEQRRVTDLKKAGLNPLLAAGNPASAPTIAPQAGGQASTPMTTNPGQAFGNLGSQLASAAQVGLTMAQTDKTHAEAEAAAGSAPYAAAQAKAGIEQTQQNTQTLKAEMYRLQSEFDFNTLAKTPNAIETQRVYQDYIVPLQRQLMQLEIQENRYGLPHLAADAEFWSTMSPEAKNILLGAQAVTGPVHAAASVAPYFLGAP